jgi:hypothetical protein
MNKKKITIAIVSTFFIIGLFWVHNTTIQKNDPKGLIIELESVMSFPEVGGEVYLANPVNFTFSETGVFISDQLASAIYQFDYYGNFIRQIGKPGSGPEEFMMQARIAYSDNRLFVNDQGNGRFTMIQLEDNTFHSWLLQNRPIEFITESESATIFTNHWHSSDTYNIEQLPLIWSYNFELNQNGFELNERKSFGEHLQLVHNMPPVGSRLYLRIYDDHLYVLFQYYPILHIYTLNGQLTHTFTFDEYYRDMIPGNYEESTFANPLSIPTRRLFSGFDITEEGLFFYVYDDAGVIIDHFDHEGVLRNQFRKVNKDGKYEHVSLEVIPQEDGDLFFYVLYVENGFPKVEVFKWNRTIMTETVSHMLSNF